MRVRWISGLASIGGIAEVLAWWAVLQVVYLASLSTAPVSEIVTSAVVSFPCALLAALARRAAAERWRFAAPLGRAVALLPAAIVMDTLRVMALALRPWKLRKTPGRLREFVLPVEPEAEANARLSAGGAIISASPGTFVVDDEPDAKRLVLHTLVDGWPSIPERVGTE